MKKRTCIQVSSVALSCVLGFMTNPALSVETVPYIHKGEELNMTLHRDEVFIILEEGGSVALRDSAILFAEHGVSDRVSDGATTGIVTAKLNGPATEADRAEIEALQEVWRALPMIRHPNGTAMGVTGRIVVKTTRSPRLIAEEFNLIYDLDSTTQVSIENMHVFTIDDIDPAVLFSRSAEIERDDDVVYAHPELFVPHETRQVTVTDELFDLQWHLDNKISNDGADINVLAAWQETLGSGIRIGMHDDGCAVNHVDLSPNFLGTSLDIRTRGPIPAGDHGTAVMGLIVSQNNNIGVRGVAPEANFVASGPLGGFSLQTVSAYTFAKQNDVDVHNNSWGVGPGGMTLEEVEEAIIDAANTGRNGLGIVFAFAAGNDGTELQQGDDYGTLDEVIQVGASGQRDTIASYSEYGPTLDVMGPSRGDDSIGLVTTDIPGQGGYNNGNVPGDLEDPNYTNSFGGTSGASPVVAGVAALVLGVNADLNRYQVRQVLIHTAEKIAPQDADYDGVRGNSNRYGFGRVDAEAAVGAAMESLAGNETWPGSPTDFDLLIVENLNDDIESDTLIIDMSWQAGGMQVNDNFQSDQTNVVIVYNQSGEALSFTPTDGATYGHGDLLDPLSGDEVDDEVYVVYAGPVAGNDNRQTLPEGIIIGMDGDEDDARQFGIFAANSRGQYAYGQVINQDGNIVPPPGMQGPGSGDQPLPPDSGGSGNPELDPGEPGHNDPPSVSATVDRTLGRAPLTIQFYGNAMTPLAIDDRGWSFGDGSSDGDEATQHTYSLPGVYNAVFFAENEKGIATKLIRIEVQDENGFTGPSQQLPPTAQIDLLTPEPIMSPNAVVRLRVATTGIAEASPDSIVTYSWEFGDGNTGTGQTTENMYTGAGFFAVVVRVVEQTVEGETITVSASSVVEVGGPMASGADVVVDTGTAGQNEVTGTGACGATAPALLALSLIGLCGLRINYRRKTLR